MNKIAGDLSWSFPVVVSQIPEGGLHQAVEAGPEQLRALTALANINAVRQATAVFDLARIAGDRVHVTGHVKAILEQTCVVTLEPLENVIDEPIDVIFTPADQIPVTPKVVTKEEGEDAEIPDPPEPIVNGRIDLGQLAAEILMLGIDPYPRKPGAVFDLPEEPNDPDAHPFAALRALKTPPAKGKPKKPNTH